jgi:DNA-directed RNA polymerases I, II, and III subunit RPABC4
MSSQSYQLPTQNAGFGTAAAAGDGSSGPLVSYVCGDCASKVQLSKGDIIRCHMCGHRVLYKERTKRYILLAERGSSQRRDMLTWEHRMVQFEAR